ncbi:hypothetical protein LCGC14_1554610 [marine sediment metagenome]|uniref:Uncharacterized protein n=1 Tax=marine sediment metagenome TaxID=412755 RepID=A0A0F9L5G6_9ZZZZ
MVLAILIKYIFKWFVIALVLIYLTGCIRKVYVIMPPKETTKDDPLKETILKTFSEDQAIILAFERQYGNAFNIAKNLHQYKQTDKTPTYDEFYVWVMRNIWYKNWWYEKIEPGSLQKRIDSRFDNHDYIEIKKNYELFIKIGK